MKRFSILGIILFLQIILLAGNHVMAQETEPGKATGEKIAERVESQETSSSDQKALVKEIAETARKAGKDNPNDAEKVKKAVKNKLDEIKERKSKGSGKNRKPGGKNNKEVEEWIKKLKRELTDKGYVSIPNALGSGMLLSATGTGRTTGHIADLILDNQTENLKVVEVGPYFIPSVGRYQSYVSIESKLVEVQAQSSVTVPVHGYCADIHTPPVPAGENMASTDNWINLSGEIPNDWKPETTNGWEPNAESILVVPGTDKPLKHQINVNNNPEEAAPILLDMVSRITSTYDLMKEEGNITTPFSGNPEKERESVIQQAFWISAAALNGATYKMSDFSEKTTVQFENATGTKVVDLPDGEKEQLESGVADFWNTFQAVGIEAKVFRASPDEKKQ